MESFRKNGLGDALIEDANGELQWNPNKFTRFAMLNVTASNSEDVLNNVDESMLLRPFKSDSAKKDFTSIISTKDRQYKVDDLYEGVAFVPMNARAIQAQTASNNLPQVKRYGDKTYNQQEGYEANRAKLSRYISTNKNVLQ